MAKVLVIDDEVLLLRATVRVLSKAFDVVPATSSDEALKACGDVDLVLSDFSMPGENGVQLARRVRASGFRGMYLLLTAVAEAEELETALKDGLLDGVISKPWEPATLAQQVKDRLAAHTARLTPGVKNDPA